MNQYESQAIREAWISKGCQETADPARADCILINSCAVTGRGRARPAQDRTENAPGKTPGPPLSSRAAPERSTPRNCGSCPAWPMWRPNPGKTNCEAGSARLSPDLRPKRPPEQPPEAPPEAIAGYPRARAVVKVQDGCSHGCTFCIVPLTRGPSRSRDPQAILEELRRLFAAGFCEASLSGVNLRHYGRDLTPAMDFWDLLAYLENGLKEWRGKTRLRLSSLDPGQLTQKALETLAKAKLVCPHLHLSLQSGSPEILRRMGRGHYQPQPVLDFLKQLASIWPVHGLGADLLTGFPGESEAHFQETLSLCEALPLTHAHVFPYSPRPGTAAAEFPGQTGDAEKKERAACSESWPKEKTIFPAPAGPAGLGTRGGAGG